MSIRKRPVRAQDPIGQGQPAHRDGSGAQDPEAARERVDERRLHRFLQGAHSGNLPPSLRDPRTHMLISAAPFSLLLLQLETDSTLLIPKARKALARYGHQVVIGNDLHRRKFEVVFVSPADGLPAQDNGDEPDPALFSESWVRTDLTENPAKEIEEDIVVELVRRHRVWTGES